jgi:hypothetical protein
MLEAATFRERTGRAPLFLLDDPFAELDARRTSRILAMLARDRLGQTMLAVPRESDIPSELTGLEPRFRLTTEALGSLPLDLTRMHALIGEAQVPWRDGVRRMVEARFPELLR